MHRLGLGLVFVGAVAVAANANATAQESKTTTKTTTKVELKGGKDVTVRGCLERIPGGTYLLSSVDDEGKLGRTRYEIVTDEDLSKHAGQRVEIKGKTTEKGDGRVKVETKETTEVPNGPDREVKSKTEATAGKLGTAFLGVDSIRTVGSCN
jgi:hypothetical protein